MKLPNGFGSVYKLSGKRRKPFVARKTVGWTFDEEKQKSFPVYEFIGYYETRKDALIALTEYNQNPYDIEASKITFKEVYDKWSEEHFKKISHSNINGIKASIKVCDILMDMRFNEIKLSHLQSVIDKSGKNQPTLKKLKITFSLMWEWAIKHEICSPDRKAMIKHLDISQAENPNKLERKPFTQKQVDKIWSVVDSNDYMSVILMLIYSGVRISELLELRKEDVHIDEQWFFVRESKTASGIREVPIADKVLPFFKKWDQKDSDWLICTPEGKHMSYRNFFDHYWLPLLHYLGEDFVNHKPHDTRHTCVSMLTTAGVDDRIIKKIVGHKGQDVTEQVYMHLELPVKLQAINKI